MIYIDHLIYLLFPWPCSIAAIALQLRSFWDRIIPEAYAAAAGKSGLKVTHFERKKNTLPFVTLGKQKTLSQHRLKEPKGPGRCYGKSQLWILEASPLPFHFEQIQSEFLLRGAVLSNFSASTPWFIRAGKREAAQISMWFSVRTTRDFMSVEWDIHGIKWAKWTFISSDIHSFQWKFNGIFMG